MSSYLGHGRQHIRRNLISQMVSKRFCKWILYASKVCFRASIYEKSEAKSIIDFVQMVLVRDPIFNLSRITVYLISPVFKCSGIQFFITTIGSAFLILFVGVILCAVILIIALKVGFRVGSNVKIWSLRNV